jgi:hypothetical protein
VLLLAVSIFVAVVSVVTGRLVILVASQQLGAPPLELALSIIAASVAFAIGFRVRDLVPSTQVFSFRPNLRRGLQEFPKIISGGVVVGAVIGGVVFPVISASPSLLVWAAMIGAGAFTGVITCGVIAAATAVPLAILATFSKPLPVGRMPSPEVLLSIDRNWSIIKSACFGVAAAYITGDVVPIVLFLISGGGMRAVPGAEESDPLREAVGWVAGPLDPLFVIAVGVPYALAFLLTQSAWGRFLFVRLGLAMSGKLPFRLISFLRDARNRRLLRQVGPGYSFRHERLRSYLESTEFLPSRRNF